ncbi:hypothetical protein BAE44_0008175 [Dichanthelium oligosanthes]|uniref:Pectinesterase inhibitor domain-containing protein n=1 Tax=Dichanthelium oligosanthes TaxID=888268 RepID=A0A1E5W0B1_9POAL|nr:hypothetical protein BAE44_0008175 [Dichanthelium oligosanthes]
MATTMSITPQASHKALLAALLCAAVAASFLPVSSSAGASSSLPPLVSQTCRRTSSPPLCLDLLQSSNRSNAATTVRELAVVALTAARRSVLRARLRALDLGHGARGSVVDRLVARCAALYGDCLRAGARALGQVSTMPAYDDRAGDAVSALRAFPVKCEGLFRLWKLASPLEQVNRETEDKLGVASEIVHLLG